MSRDLIGTARRLAKANPRRPKQADLKRAVSTAYFAVFDELAQLSADLFVGRTSERRNSEAWRQVYRGLEHGIAKNACRQVANLDFSPGVKLFAGSFVELQEERHSADYDPAARYTRPYVLGMIAAADLAVTTLASLSRDEQRAFVVHVHFKRR